jgi:hypothetical protein
MIGLAGSKTLPATGPQSGATPIRVLPPCDSLAGTIGGVVGRAERHTQFDPHLQPGVALASLAAQHGLIALERQHEEQAQRWHAWLAD